MCCFSTGENSRTGPYWTTSSVSLLTHITWALGLASAVQERLRVPTPSWSWEELTLEMLTVPRSEIVSVRGELVRLSQIRSE